MIPPSIQRISLLQLRYFISIVKNESFSKAATECNITQATISLQISTLEEILGFTLIERGNRQISLTPVGRIFYNNIYAIMLSLENVFLDIEQIAMLRLQNARAPRDAELSIRIGYYGGWEKIVITELIRSIRAKHPHSKLTFNFILPSHIGDALEEGIVDVVFVSSQHGALPNAEYMKVRESRIGVVVPADNPLAQRDDVGLSELSREYFIPLAQFPGVGGAENIGNSSTIENFSVMTPYQEADIQNVLVSVESGLGVSLFPEALQSYMDNPHIHFLRLIDQHRPIAMYCAWKNGFSGNGIAALKEAVREYGNASSRRAADAAL